MSYALACRELGERYLANEITTGIRLQSTGRQHVATVNTNVATVNTNVATVNTNVATVNTKEALCKTLIHPELQLGVQAALFMGPF
jgi:hypothetical protein